MIVMFTRDDERRYRTASGADIRKQDDGAWVLSMSLGDKVEIVSLVDGDYIQVFDDTGNELETYEFATEDYEEDLPDGQEEPPPSGMWFKVLWGLAAVGLLLGFFWRMSH